MNKQIILCVEANEDTKTDNIYINETIYHYFEVDNSTKITYVNMNNKSRYKSRSVLAKIKRYRREYLIGDSYVIYCIDLDKVQANPIQQREDEAIANYVKQNGFELIWFCRDIEEVYTGKRVSKKDKTSVAKTFKTRKSIKNVLEKNLINERASNGKSNILKVLGKYLKRKA